jgi:hypothetical protein
MRYVVTVAKLSLAIALATRIPAESRGLRFRPPMAKMNLTVFSMSSGLEGGS